MKSVKFFGVVLNGGESSRMGESKGDLQFLGRPLMETSLSALRESGASEIVVIGGGRPSWLQKDVAHIGDKYPGEGPIGGLITALTMSSEENVMVLSNDFMNIDGTTIQKILENANGSNVIVPVVGGHRQVLSALWRRSSLPVVCEAYDSGIRSVQSVLDLLTVNEVFEFDESKFVNANTPSDIIDYIATLGRSN